MSFRKFVELIGSGEELATLDDTGTLQRRSVVDFRALIGLKIVYVRGASTANIASLSGALTHDGITYATGDQILLKNQSTASRNGVYRVNTAGAWTRSVEHDSSDEIRQRDVVCTADGTTNKMGYAWCCTNTGTITVGTTSITFAQYPVGIGTGNTNAAAGNHSHTSIATTAASTFGASVGVRYASRTATGSTASTDVSVVFSGSTANQIETIPDGTALSNNSGRVIMYSNRASVPWILRQAASNSLNGSSSDYTLPSGAWILVQNTADNVWQIISQGGNYFPQPLDDDLTAIAAISTQAFGRSLLAQGSDSDVRSLIGSARHSVNSSPSEVVTIDTPLVLSIGTYKRIQLWVYNSSGFNCWLTIQPSGGGYLDLQLGAWDSYVDIAFNDLNKFVVSSHGSNGSPFGSSASGGSTSITFSTDVPSGHSIFFTRIEMSE